MKLTLVQQKAVADSRGPLGRTYLQPDVKVQTGEALFRKGLVCRSVFADVGGPRYRLTDKGEAMRAKLNSIIGRAA